MWRIGHSTGVRSGLRSPEHDNRGSPRHLRRPLGLGLAPADSDVPAVAGWALCPSSFNWSFIMVRG